MAVLIIMCFSSHCPVPSLFSSVQQQRFNHSFHSGTLQAMAMSANTVHNQSGRFNGIWVKLASNSVVLPPSFSLQRAHTDGRTHFETHFPVLSLCPLTLWMRCTYSRSPTVLLCYCAHLYCMKKLDFTDIKFRVILPSAKKWL